MKKFKTVSSFIFASLLTLSIMSSCAGTQAPSIENINSNVIPDNMDQRNELLKIIRQFESIKGTTFFYGDFEKKGDVCPLCQF